MKIGCITSDGKSVEQVDLSVVKETVYSGSEPSPALSSVQSIPSDNSFC